MAASSRSALIVALVIVLSCAAAAKAAKYTVGDDQGWRLGVNYSAWASGKTFAVGDVLEFNFVTGEHDVVKAGDDSCSTSDARWKFNQSKVSTIIDYTGYHYFICSFPYHCSYGMKLTVVVEPGTPPADGASARLQAGAGPTALALAAAVLVKLARLI
ncbi:unnamed protein product [Urochloa humidicola]